MWYSRDVFWIYYRYPALPHNVLYISADRSGAAVRLSEKAYHLIKEKIVTLDLKPLAVIDEQALKDELDLGRTPIREALHRLAAEGLVIIAPRRGMFVADISITDLQKVFEVRMIMEGFCARLAAQRATREQIAQMETVLEQLGRVADDDAEALMTIDTHLHELLYQAADNEFLADSLLRLHALSLRLWHLVLNQLDDVKASIQEHEEIIAALQARDGMHAEKLLQRHIAHFQQEIKAAL
jgi:DNA-binding GntR family transcriptional regulator